MVTDKKLITEKILELLEIKDYDLEKMLYLYWYAPNYNTMRLSSAGNEAFISAQIEYFDFNFELKNMFSYNKLFVGLGKKIKCPYYLNFVKQDVTLRIFDSKIAMLITLYGSVDLYLESVE